MRRHTDPESRVALPCPVSPHALCHTYRLVLAATAAFAVCLPGTLAEDDPPPEETPPRSERVEEVEVTGQLDLPVQPGATVLEVDELETLGVQNLTEALVFVPGAHVSLVGGRGEGIVSLRGYGLRHVPIHIDGMPVTIPYDGSADIDRFLVGGFDAIVVNRGFASLMYGPNGLGGGIDLVTRRPSEPLEIDAAAQWRDERSHTASVNVGGRRGMYYGSVRATSVSQDGFPMSSDFVPAPGEDGGMRDQAAHDDTHVALTLGATPSENEEYALVLIRQRADKQQPIYAGTDPSVRSRYWRWPRWDKDSISFRSHTGFDSGAYLNARAYYDVFENTLDSYDDATFSSQTRPYAFNDSEYDDSGMGASVTYGFSPVSRHTPVLSAHYRQDVHRERTDGGPWSRYEDVIWSVGVEDRIAVSTTDTLVAGVRYDDQGAEEAAGLGTGSTSALNAQLEWTRRAAGGARWHALAAQRTRLPTLKDRYSFRLGRSIPNPDLDPEQALSVEAGLEYPVGRGSTVSGTVFYSRMRDAIEPFFVEPNVYQLRNRASVRHRGVELAWRGRIGTRHDLTAAYTLLDRSASGESGLPDNELPEHVISAQLRSRITERVALTAGVQIESSRNALNDAGAPVPLGGFALWNAGLSWNATPALRWDVGVTNLFDRNVERVEGYPEPGRRLYARLAWSM